MFAAIGLIMPLISGIITPFVKAWTDYKLQAIKSNTEGFQAAVSGDVATTTALVNAEYANNQLKAAAAGHPVNRAVMWIVGIPVSVHFSLVIVDTILSMHALYGHAVLGVPKLPAPYDGYAWAIVESFFLLQTVHVGAGNVAQWLGRSKN